MDGVLDTIASDGGYAFPGYDGSIRGAFLFVRNGEAQWVGVVWYDRVG